METQLTKLKGLKTRISRISRATNRLNLLAALSRKPLLSSVIPSACHSEGWKTSWHQTLARLHPPCNLILWWGNKGPSKTPNFLPTKATVCNQPMVKSKIWPCPMQPRTKISIYKARILLWKMKLIFNLQANRLWISARKSNEHHAVKRDRQICLISGHFSPATGRICVSSLLSARINTFCWDTYRL